MTNSKSGSLHPNRLLAAWILAAALVGGCQNKGSDRTAVSGEVTLDGQPLATGMITVIPIRGTPASAEIANGKFAISAGVGPSPGECTVEILSYKKTGRKIPGIGADGTDKTDEVIQIVPDRYNVRSTLKQTLKPGSDNPFTFELKSRP